MTKLAALVLCFCIALPTALGACADATVFTNLGLPAATAPTSIVGQSANFCTRLTATGAGSACCVVGTLNNFQSDLTTLNTTLVSSFTAKDKAILDARRNVRSLAANYTALYLLLNSSKTNLDTWAAQTTDTTLQTNAGKVKTFITSFNTWFANVITNYDAIQKNFDTYQTNRASCVSKLYEVKSNLKCQVCGEDGGTGIFTGTTPNVLDAAAATKTALAGACYDYINGSNYQGSIINLNAYNTSLTSMLTSAVLMANNTSSGVASFVATMTSVSGVANRDPAPTTMPSATDCASSSACDWVTANFLSDGKFGDATTQANVVRGGITATLPSRRMLNEEGHGRLLAWTYTATASGVSTSFPSNPGNLKNEVDPNPLSAFRVGVISSLVALFALLF